MIKIFVTPQQKHALDLLYMGKSYRQIADVLHVSYSRVIQIFNTLLLKTKLSSRKELILEKNKIKYELKQ